MIVLSSFLRNNNCFLSLQTVPVVLVNLEKTVVCKVAKLPLMTIFILINLLTNLLINVND